MATTLIKATLGIGIGGALFCIFCLAINGAGDNPASFLGYLQACAILVGAATIAAAIAGRGSSGT